jgi:tryptophanyl-tRNA synthetase
MKKRVLSGIQPSGELHLGNYLGALRRWVDVQDQWDCFYCVVDLHAITIPRDPVALKESTRSLAALYFAAGINPEKARVFVQSHVQEHAELAWILNCQIPIGWLKRMTQFKDKAGKNQDQVSAGLFVYPALMAADILLYQTELVPVGHDQKQHVELTRDVAQMFNQRYGEVFTIPEPLIAKAGARIMGLDDPTRKMAKTGAAPNRCVYLLDSPDVIRKKIARATTDSGAAICFDPNRPGVNNLLTIYQLLSGQTPQWIEDHFAGKMYSHLKQELVEVVVESLRPIRERYHEIIQEPDYLTGCLSRGAEAARRVAGETLRKVKSQLGLG